MKIKDAMNRGRRTKRQKAFLLLIIVFFFGACLAVIVYKIAKMYYTAKANAEANNPPFIDPTKPETPTNNVPDTNSSLPQVAPDVSAIPAFTFQYGVIQDGSNNLIPWVCQGTNLYYGAFTNGSAEFQFVKMIVGLPSAPTGDNEAIRWTVPVPGQLTASVQIERSSDLLNWSTVGTDPACDIDGIKVFTDSNAPPGSAFYRLKLIGEPSTQ